LFALADLTEIWHFDAAIKNQLMVHGWHKIFPESDVVCLSYANIPKGFVVFFCNAILVTEIFCYRYSTINNAAKK